MCATVCPAKVIEIEAAFDPNDPAHPKYPARFEIDYCAASSVDCVSKPRPEDAIRMVPEVPGLPTFDRHSSWLSIDELLTWNPRDVGKAISAGAHEQMIETVLLAFLPPRCSRRC